MEKQKQSLQIWAITKVNLKHNFLPLFLLSIIVILLAPVLFGTTNLDSKASAVPLEMLISIIGIILLIPIFQPEQDPEIADVTASKYVDSTYVYCIRTAYSVIGMILLVLAFSFFMLACGCQITAKLIFGTIADGMFLGSLGLLTAAVTSNLPVSFMVPLLYYVLTLTMKDKLGNFNLFAMMSENYEPNIWLFITSILLIAISLFLKRNITILKEAGV